MKKSRLGALVAVAAASALVLAGCSAGSGDSGDTIKKGSSVTAAQNSSFSSYNSNSANGNSTYNSNITYMTSGNWFYYDSTPKLVLNEKFGTVEKLKDDPLTVKYTIKKGVEWSDGVQIGAADLLMNWATGLTKYNDEKGVNFTSAAAGLTDAVSKVPEVGDGGRSITLTFDKQYVDWQLFLGFGVGPVAAHAAYTEAFPDVKGAKADDAFVKAIQDDDTATLTKVASAWSTKFDWTDMPSDKLLYLSSGPYIVSAAKKDQYITLTANKKYTWGPQPHLEKITVRFIQDPTAQVQALQNGEVQVISGQATADTVTALKALKNVTTTTTPTSTYEHIDLTMNNGGPFDPKTYGGDADKAKLVRQAFMLTIPRQQIVDNLIKPIQSDAKLVDSQVFLPGAAGYDESVANNGSSDYAKVDIDKAKQLLAQAGVKTPVNVKFMYGKSNTRRAAEYALIAASAKQAGFNVIDAGNDDWSSLLGNGSYDAVLFAWQFTSLAVLGSQATFTSNGGSNFNGYNNATVDSDFKTLESTIGNASKQKELLANVDKEIWGDAYGVTVFQFPDVTGFSNKVTGVKDAPLSPNVFWNFFDWKLK
ncbi:MAG: ABC transporter family substrate-binding protein [Microbacterium sp.]|uniref:ABC transporter family substrate-binding protein n=1 Tax=Microbacterium sp. TaxID=51671 RepID=UPI001AC98B35|nr:ABC transporter family substrate-binding protein [Microbacterium sp.]MBN9153136.1 ABC transporter family substrate-binding protein [Microbacterium sp.]